MSAYYNEIDPYAAQWLRNLIANKLIADGDVDERSIRDVVAADLHGYTQCHFFAGIGVWSHALRLAGWPDDRPVWTGSCPCQPFSAAGKGKAFDDERHLWPEFHRLIAECRPPVVFGEQVASKDGLGWLDTVHADMEASGYACGAADLCAAGVGAPHIRQRLWFVGERLGNADSPRHEGHGLQSLHGSRQGREPFGGTAGSGTTGGLGHDDDAGLEGQRSGHQTEGGWNGAAGPVAEAGEPRGVADAQDQRYRRREMGDEKSAQRTSSGGGPDERLRQPSTPGASGDGGLANAAVGGWGQGGQDAGRVQCGDPAQGAAGRSAVNGNLVSGQRPSPPNGHWRDADWLFCRDGKWRPVEPGTFPLAHGAPARVGRLRAYGNAIVPQAAAEVIGAYLDARP